MPGSTSKRTSSGAPVHDVAPDRDAADAVRDDVEQRAHGRPVHSRGESRFRRGGRIASRIEAAGAWRRRSRRSRPCRPRRCRGGRRRLGSRHLALVGAGRRVEAQDAVGDRHPHRAAAREDRTRRAGSAAGPGSRRRSRRARCASRGTRGPAGRSPSCRGSTPNRAPSPSDSARISPCRSTRSCTFRTLAVEAEDRATVGR